MARFTDKVAVVTGASKAIGAGSAKRLAAAGAAAVVNYAKSADGAKICAPAPIEGLSASEFNRHFDSNVPGLLLATPCSRIVAL